MVINQSVKIVVLYRQVDLAIGMHISEKINARLCQAYRNSWYWAKTKF